MAQESDSMEITARLEAAIGALTDVGIVRLCRKVAYLAIGTPDGDVMALFNEAIARTLNGTREWPQELPFEVFIFGAMKSIAHGERNLKQAKVEFAEVEFAKAGEDEPSESLLDRVRTQGAQGVDETIIERDEKFALQADLDALADHFKGDEDVELVLAALEDGTPRKVLLEDFGMTLTQYESARKKLRRGADTLFRGRRMK